MPPYNHMEGIEAAHAIRKMHPEVGVVVLSQHADEVYAFELLKDGTAGLAYLLKDRVADPDELLRALREVIAGRSVIDSEVVDALVASRARRAVSPLSHLTPRELDVLRAMAQGRTNPAIAKSLSLSESAVEKHATSIFSKLGLSEEIEIHRRVAAVLALLEGTLAPGPGEVDAHRIHEGHLLGEGLWTEEAAASSGTAFCTEANCARRGAVGPECNRL